ncbi:M23 family metallopeptidase [Pontimicrobium sp. SW4]|uniref:M23 family metallopeptidase n=1 Tax=Pontimicrobium sp. SW4 TaxID=3153519 RepID=A0AAU7BWT3_9FLAO
MKFPNAKPIASITIDNDSLKSSFIEKSANTIDIKGEFWDTQKFNPFKDEVVKFPIQIKFEDSIYRSPILDSMVITSRFGWRNRRAHKGIDIDLITGDDVVSILDGVVRFTRYNSGHGKTVIVRHYNGLETVYAHLSSYAVKVNDSVKRGQILGKGGATGNARGSHLHLIVNYKGIAINPEYLFDFKEANKIRSSEIWVTRRWATPYLHSSKRRTKLELLSTEDEAKASLVKEIKIYVVKRGDTLSHISRRNNVSIRSICIANNIKSTTLLKVGQKLKLEM